MSRLLVLAGVSIVIGVAADFIVSNHEPFEWRSFTKRALRHAITVFVLGTFFEMFAYINEIHAISVRQTTDAFSQAQQSLTEAGTTSLFAREAAPRLDGARDRLQRIAQGEIPLDSPDDVTATWLRLFGLVSNTVKATNVIDPSFWQKAHNMGAEAAAGHRNAIARGVRVSRLYIIDSEPSARQAILTLARQYGALGVTNRVIDLRRLEQLSGYNDCRTKLAAIDFVIYDESVVLLVTQSARNEVLSGRLSRNREQHVDVASQCFDQWWKSAEDISSVK